AAPPRSQPPLSLVVVVDLRTLPADLLTPTRDAILGMVRGGLQPDMRLMLVVLDQGMEIRQAFTTDRTRFADAVLSLAPTSASEGAALADLVERVEVLCADLTIRNVDQQAVGIARAFVEDVRQGLSNTTDGLGALARYLAPLPGRKHVVFYSAGYPMQPQSIAASVVEALCYRGSPQGSGRSAMQAGPNEAHTAVRAGAAVDASGMLHALLDEANRSQVSIYTVDARGLVPDGVPGSQRAPTQVIRLGLGNPQQIQQRAVRDPQEILHSLAEGTGGVAALNTNDLARGLLAAARDGRGYYLVGYVPRGARKEGRFYPIALKVSRPGLQLRYRRGFEWLSEERRRDRAMSAALRFPKLFSDGGLTLDSWLEAGKLNVAALIPPRALAFRNEGGTFLSEIAVQGLLRDESGRVVGERYLFSKTVSLRLPAERHADLLTRDNLEIANQAPAPKKGRYLLSVVARHSGGRLATASLEFEVP
ncbi:MAG: VWA domain-containing protein, partial [Vicinamibacteria bacterium]|nr:VWA domain-containing protein [Vicinamibacteria bacterium]